MKKLLSIIFALGTLFAVVPNALALTKAFQVNTLSGGTLTTGLVSYWNMEGNSNDYYGSNNGTDTSVSYGTSYGKVNQGASFNGSTSKIITGSNVGITGSASRSMAFWAKDTSWNGTSLHAFAGWGADTTGNDFSFGIYQSQWYFFGATSAYDFGTGVTPDNNYNFFVITYNGSTLTVYINGSSIGSKSMTLNTTNSSFYMGLRPNGTDGFYPGYLDEVGIWSKALSTQEISDLYNAGAGQTMCNGTGGPLCSTPRRHQIVSNGFDWKFEHFIFT